MGSNQSTTFRNVQPSLPYAHHYDRLSSSPPSYAETQQPLLLDIGDDQGKEQLKLEFDANLRKNESLEKKNTALEKEIGQLRAAISKLEIRAPAPEKKNNLEREIHELKVAISKLESLPLSKEQKNINGILEREIHDLKAAVSKLNSRPHTQMVPATSHLQSDRALKEEVDTLTVRVMNVELTRQRRRRTDQTKKTKNKPDEEDGNEDDEEAVKGRRRRRINQFQRKQEIDAKKVAELERKIVELDSTVEQLKFASFNFQATSLSNPAEVEPMILEPVIQDSQMNDLFSCLIVLIFLISILIGVNL